MGTRLTLRARYLSGQGLGGLDFEELAEIAVATLTHVLGEAVEKKKVSFVSADGEVESFSSRRARAVGVTYLAALLTMTLSAMMGG